jgi:hypothetical protein
MHLVAGVAGIFAISAGLWLYEIWRIGRDMRRERADATERRLRKFERPDTPIWMWDDLP